LSKGSVDETNSTCFTASSGTTMRGTLPTGKVACG
jgi:hypothetical protein